MLLYEPVPDMPFLYFEGSVLLLGYYQDNQWVASIVVLKIERNDFLGNKFTGE